MAGGEELSEESDDSREGVQAGRDNAREEVCDAGHDGGPDGGNGVRSEVSDVGAEALVRLRASGGVGCNGAQDSLMMWQVQYSGLFKERVRLERCEQRGVGGNQLTEASQNTNKGTEVTNRSHNGEWILARVIIPGVRWGYMRRSGGGYELKEQLSNELQWVVEFAACLTFHRWLAGIGPGRPGTWSVKQDQFGG
ncbi:hypothetical protein C8R44DRAFT_723841 [Mycena epipterygia]|nr:hypothetical protein C8R44DRAFT_723841 [Mycena epipterygia]